MNFMVDLETMGKRSDAAITAIGAVAFDETCEEINHFYRVVDLQSCLDAGMTVDASTIYWWMERSEPARLALREPDIDLQGALNHLYNWMDRLEPNEEDRYLWAKGTDFDLPILRTAIRLCGLHPWWSYYNVHDLRTLISEAPEDFMFPERLGDIHHALDDARYQVEVLKPLWDRMTRQQSS